MSNPPPDESGEATTLWEAVRFGWSLAGGDSVKALEIASLAILDGTVRRYEDRPSGKPGRSRIDDVDALDAIRAKHAECPDWSLARVMRAVRPNATAADFKRWRRKLPANPYCGQSDDAKIAA